MEKPEANRRESGVDELDSGLSEENGMKVAGFGDLRLHTHFQPIFSVAHERIVGYEAYLRADTAEGTAVAPADVFRTGGDVLHTLRVDRLSGKVHFHNFRRLEATGAWLFANVNPQAFIEGPAQENYFAELLQATGLPAHRTVLEVVERAVDDEVRFAAAVQAFRSQGFLIAFDDFGTERSNFDRVWNLRPDIVKLGRTMTAQAGANLRIRRMMPVIVSLLHEAGSLVLMDGIETTSEALMAIDVDADFVQGYYFAIPAESPAEEAAVRPLFDRLWSDFREVTLPEAAYQRREISPYRNAIGYSAGLLESGIPLAAAADGFLALPGAERCYLLDAEGRQLGDSVLNRRQSTATDKRFQPLQSGNGANWSRRFYFRRALDNPGKVQVSRPYLSIAGANQCITVSISLQIEGETRVLCGDVSWRDRGVVKR